jgi:hypothetical protein
MKIQRQLSWRKMKVKNYTIPMNMVNFQPGEDRWGCKFFSLRFYLHFNAEPIRRISIKMALDSNTSRDVGLNLRWRAGQVQGGEAGGELRGALLHQIFEARGREDQGPRLPC